MIHTKQLGRYRCFTNKIIGSGFSSKVYLGEDTATRTPVVFKIIDNERINTTVMEFLLKNQIKALQMIDHPYVLQTYAFERNDKQILIVCEYCKGGDLMQNITRQGAIEQAEALQILRQIASGVNYIHSLGMLHRDLKTSNILITSEDTIKITDFGFCQFVKERPPGHKFVNVGSPLYMSPEAYKKNQYSTKSDAWSLGVILYQMLIGTTPFLGYDYDGMVLNVRNGNLIRALDVSDYCKNILFGLLQVDTKTRWDTSQLLVQLSHCQNSNSCCLTQGYNNSGFSKQGVDSNCCWF